MSKTFRIHVLPAQRGDALWVEYGPKARPHRILVDGGISKTGREHLIGLMQGLGDDAHIDLLVVTHIDLDHIQGVIALLAELPANVTIDRVWFNGWDQLPRDPLQPHGIKEGIELSKQLEAGHAAAWNVDSGGRAIAVGPDGAVPAFDLPGGMVARVLSPDHARLLALKDDWDDVIEAFGAAEEAEVPVDLDADEIEGLEPMGADEIDVPELAQSRFTEDKTVPNGSSIAVLLEFAGKRALLLGDAHPGVVLQGLKRLSPAAPLQLDCVKLSHHGSKNNTSRDLVQHMRSPNWIFSSNGASTRHPNPESVARVLHDSPGAKTLIFNYRTQYNEIWDDAELMAAHDYGVVYGDGKKAVELELLD